MSRGNSRAARESREGVVEESQEVSEGGISLVITSLVVSSLVIAPEVSSVRE
jgi:hypothetical protein